MLVDWYFGYFIAWLAGRSISKNLLYINHRNFFVQFLYVLFFLLSLSVGYILFFIVGFSASCKRHSKSVKLLPFASALCHMACGFRFSLKLCDTSSWEQKFRLISFKGKDVFYRGIVYVGLRKFTSF